MQEGYLKQLIKKGMLDNNNGVMQDYIDRKELVPVSMDEIKEHVENGGYINYIGHNKVERDTSSTSRLW